MADRPREPRRRGLAALALLAAVACGTADRAGTAPSASSAAPTPSATTTTSTPHPLTPSPTGRPYVVGVIGDWGVDGTAVRQVVGAMARFNGPRPLDAVFTTGDNAYNRGTETESQRSRRLIAPLRNAGVPIHPALGNHDVVTEGGAVFMRAFGMRRRWYTVTVGAAQFVILDSTRVTDAAQTTFLKNVLAAPRPGAFRVVAFHHPGWSCSAHSPHPDVVRHWLPLFGTKVDLVLSGHNHTYERFEGTGGVPYVTTGGGGATLYSSATLACRGQGKVRHLKTAHHALRLTVTATALRVEAVGVDGTAFDKFTLAPR